MPTTLSHLFSHSSLFLSLSLACSTVLAKPLLFSSCPLLSSELLLSQSNVCVYLINSETLLITATGRYVAWMVTRWPGQEQYAASELKWNLDRDATLTWHHPANQLVLFFFSPSTHFTYTGLGYRCQQQGSGYAVKNAERMTYHMIFYSCKVTLQCMSNASLPLWPKYFTNNPGWLDIFSYTECVCLFILSHVSVVAPVRWPEIALFMTMDQSHQNITYKLFSTPTIEPFYSSKRCS